MDIDYDSYEVKKELIEEYAKNLKENFLENLKGKEDDDGFTARIITRVIDNL